MNSFCLSCEYFILQQCVAPGLYTLRTFSCFFVYTLANKFVDAQPARRMRVKFLIHALLIRNLQWAKRTAQIQTVEHAVIEKAIFTFTAETKGYS
jgi:hypothetical protein